MGGLATSQQFLELYERDAEAVLFFFTRRTLDVDVALDLTAETFAQAWRGWARVRLDSTQGVDGWLFTIARRQLGRYLRRGTVERRALSRLGVAVPALDDEAIAEIERAAGPGALRGALGAELEKLSEKQRRALQLRIVEELPYPEVARRLGTTEPTARARVSRGLRAFQQMRNLDAGYSLWARVSRTGQPQRIAPELGARGRAGPDPIAVVEADSLSAPGRRIATIVPDGVARVGWIWPREFVSFLLRFEPAATVTATARENVAVAAAPAQFSSLQELQPETVVWYTADGTVVGRFSDPGDSAAVALSETYVGPVPGSETAQSRAAERDPATPNGVVMIPHVTTLRSVTRGPGPAFFFKVLLNGRQYSTQVSGGPRPGCVRPEPNEGPPRGPLAERIVRGDTYMGNVPLGVIRCSGNYRLSVSVLGAGNRPYPAFGSAAFTVR